MRRLVYYVGSTIDGYIAGPNGEFDFYPMCDDMSSWIGETYPESIPTHVRELVGMPTDTPNRTWDTVVMGRGAYEPALAEGVVSPYDHLKQYVFSRTLAPVDHPRVDIVDTDPVELIRKLKAQEGLDIWLCGGSKLAAALAPEIDELILKINPVVLGEGLPLFDHLSTPLRTTLVEHSTYPNGFVLARYRVDHGL